MRFLSLLIAFGIAGCGGGSGSNSTRLRVQVDWAGRSRQLHGPSSALSLSLLVRSAGLMGEDKTFVFSRDEPDEAHSTVYLSPERVSLGTFALEVRFWSKPYGAGDVVSFANALVTVQADGSGIGTIATSGTVASVTMENQQLVVGERRELQFSARDASGQTLALTTGSAAFSIIDGTDVIRFVGGQAEALKIGSASVRATVDGISSAPVIVTVLGNPYNGYYKGRIVAESGSTLTSGEVVARVDESGELWMQFKTNLGIFTGTDAVHSSGRVSAWLGGVSVNGKFRNVNGSRSGSGTYQSDLQGSVSRGTWSVYAN